MLKNLKKNHEGFTIIEVLIVLAIAGLILLIVFLAVPALQRNARNTQRRADVASLLGAAGEFASNNGGSIPTVACAATAPEYSLRTGTCASPTGTAANFKEGYYTAAPTIATGAQNALTTDTLVLVTGAKCDPANAGKTLAGAARQYAAQFQIEAGGSLTGACTDS